MTSFFTSSDKIKVGQTQVSVPSENGLNYKELFMVKKLIKLVRSKV